MVHNETLGFDDRRLQVLGSNAQRCPTEKTQGIGKTAEEIFGFLTGQCLDVTALTHTQSGNQKHFFIPGGQYARTADTDPWVTLLRNEGSVYAGITSYKDFEHILQLFTSTE